MIVSALQSANELCCSKSAFYLLWLDQMLICWILLYFFSIWQLLWSHLHYQTRSSWAICST